MIYTAQYRYPGPDRLDITVKGQDIVGKWFAPSWEMVMDWKKTGDEEAYRNLYYKLLIDRYATEPKAKEVTDNLVRLFGGEKDRDITLVCFCPANTFCHRYLLTRFLRHNWGIHYGGERKLNNAPKKS